MVQTMVYVMDFDDPKTVEEVEVTEKRDAFWVGAKKGQYYSVSNTFPLSAKGEVLSITEYRAKLKKQLTEADSLIYGLLNAVARGEYK